jgi:hypothetical protein
VSAIIAGPRTFEQWTSYVAALDYGGPEDEQLADRLVPPGHPSTPGVIDPAYPVEGRFPAGRVGPAPVTAPARSPRVAARRATRRGPCRPRA